MLVGVKEDGDTHRCGRINHVCAVYENDTWNNRTIYFQLFFCFFFPFISSLLLSFSLSLTLVQHTYKWGVCVCITHMCWPKDANRRARIAINKIPLCNYVVTISTTMRENGGLFSELLLCMKWELWKKALNYCTNNHDYQYIALNLILNQSSSIFHAMTGWLPARCVLN